MRHLKSVTAKKNSPLIIFSIFALICSALLFYLSISPLPKFNIEKYPEIIYLRSKKLDFKQLKSYFENLSEKKGAVYAFEVLNQAPMPYGIDMHLLAHAVGDELYKQKGISGMKYCTDNFRNACSHSMVINLFYEKGEAGIADINEACKEAPGKGGYSMCYHGLGHGVFAYAGYDFPKTSELCKKVSSNLTGPEFKECMGGAVMEQISGGDHDKASWQLQRDKNLKREKPLYPCMSDLISDPSSKEICLVYLTPYLWELAGKVTAEVPDDILVKSFEYCNSLNTKTDQRYRDSCFGGFGKEFLAMAKGKDIRHIDTLTDEEMRKIYRWCLLTPYQDGQKACVLYAQGSMYWSGANDKRLLEHFCDIAPSEELKNYCFEKLIITVQKGEKQDKKYLKDFCGEIPKELENLCKKQLIK